MPPVITMNGTQDTLEVYDDKVIIKPKGMLSAINKGLKGDKIIPFTSITAIQFKKAGFTGGYLQFTLPGGNESRRGVLDAVKDENSFVFSGQNELAEKIKNYIEGRMKEMRQPSISQPVKTINLAEELGKLAELKEKGVLSEEEFVAAKKKLLS